MYLSFGELQPIAMLLTAVAHAREWKAVLGYQGLHFLFKIHVVPFCSTPIASVYTHERRVQGHHMFSGFLDFNDQAAEKARKDT